MTTDRIRSAIAAAEADLLRLSHEISDDPELAFAEVRAAERVAALLERRGFAVTRGAYELPTSVEGVFGTGDLTVVIPCEYDALPTVGHACGHNVIATASVGAALGLAEVADELGLRVVLLGTPAEEDGGGKILLLQRGAWDDAALSLMVHPAPAGQLPASGHLTLALEHIEIEFTGRAAHAAAMPHTGINAGDAVTLTQVGIGLLRQQLPKSIVVASRVVEAGEATNVIPARGLMEIEIRGTDPEEWTAARERVRRVAEGAAIATGCEWAIEQTEAPYEPLDSHAELSALWDRAVTEELDYVLGEPPRGFVGGSTDMGNVSQYLPAIHPMLEIRGTSASPHHPDFAAAARSEAGDRAAIDGAIALALTAAGAAASPELRERLLLARAERAPYAEFAAGR